MADVEPRDRTARQSPRAAIVNEATAKQFYGTTDIVGNRFGWGDPPYANSTPESLQ